VDVGTLKVVFGTAIGVTIATMEEGVDALDDEKLVDVRVVGGGGEGRLRGVDVVVGVVKVGEGGDEEENNG
jgi:hypothetical protein